VDRSARDKRKAWFDGVWRDVEHGFGLTAPVPEALRQMQDAEYEADVQALGNSEAEFGRLLSDYRAGAEAKASILADFQAAQRRRGLLSGQTSQPTRRRQMDQPSRTRADSEFNQQRRLAILTFVAERTLEPTAVLGGYLVIEGRRLPWSRLVGEWNQVHPDDQLKPDALRKMWKGALAEAELCAQYVAGRRRAWLEKRQWLVENAPLLAELSGSPETLQTMARELRETADGLRALAAAQPRGAPLAKRLRDLAREVGTSAEKMERKATAEPPLVAERQSRRGGGAKQDRP
jgi:hypothetical protein